MLAGGFVFYPQLPVSLPTLEHLATLFICFLKWFQMLISTFRSRPLSRSPFPYRSHSSTFISTPSAARPRREGSNSEEKLLNFFNVLGVSKDSFKTFTSHFNENEKIDGFWLCLIYKHIDFWCCACCLCRTFGVLSVGTNFPLCYRSIGKCRVL